MTPPKLESLPEKETGQKPEQKPNEDLAKWKLFINGSLNQHGYGAGLVFQALSNKQLEYTIRMEFKATNNDVEYEVLLAGLRVAMKLGVNSLDAFMIFNLW